MWRMVKQFRFNLFEFKLWMSLNFKQFKVLNEEIILWWLEVGVLLFTRIGLLLAAEGKRVIVFGHGCVITLVRSQNIVWTTEQF